MKFLSSLRQRLLLAATITLIAFLSLAGFALDLSFRNSATVAKKNELHAQLFTVLSSMEVDEVGVLYMPTQMPEARFSSPSSGLYAFITDKFGRLVWRSESSVGLDISDLSPLEPAATVFGQLDKVNGSPFYVGYGVSWEVSRNTEKRFTTYVVEDGRFYREVVLQYRKDLQFWLLMAGLLLLLVQWVILRWGLKPLSSVKNELDQIEAGDKELITEEYPYEISQLTERINQFIDHDRKNLARYRNTMDDLAHSMKTPMAVIRGVLDNANSSELKTLDWSAINTLDEQIQRMNSILDYQLKRAAASQTTVIKQPVKVAPIATKLISSLTKVYQDKNMDVVFHCAQDAVFYGDESDIYEVLGNVFDNAYKYGQDKIIIGVQILPKREASHVGLEILVEDNGAGIHDDIEERLLERGVRADQQMSGQGIGMAVVTEIIDRYSGSLSFYSSHLGGAGVIIKFYPF